MSVFRIVFLGTPDFAAAPLAHLLEDEHFEVVLVITQPDRPAGRKMQLQTSPVKKLALERGLEVISPESVNTPEVLTRIAAARADAAVVVAFGQILRADFLALFPQRAVNVHASLLPRWRGAAPIQRALMAGDPESGVALQVIVPKLDAGAILGIRKIQLTDAMTAHELYEEMKPLSADLLSLELVDFLRGNLTPLPQDEAHVTIAKKIKKEEGFIDWTQSARTIRNQFRGLAVWPGMWTVRSGQILKVLNLQYEESAPIERTAESPGTVLSASGSGIEVATGQGRIRLLEVQPESRKRQSVDEYLKGYPMNMGEKFQLKSSEV